jgi:hypothetical protein
MIVNISMSFFSGKDSMVYFCRCKDKAFKANKAALPGANAALIYYLGKGLFVYFIVGLNLHQRNGQEGMGRCTESGSAVSLHGFVQFAPTTEVIEA